MHHSWSQKWREKKSLYLGVQPPVGHSVVSIKWRLSEDLTCSITQSENSVNPKVVIRCQWLSRAMWGYGLQRCGCRQNQKRPRARHVNSELQAQGFFLFIMFTMSDIFSDYKNAALLKIWKTRKSTQENRNILCAHPLEITMWFWLFQCCIALGEPQVSGHQVAC